MNMMKHDHSRRTILKATGIVLGVSAAPGTVVSGSSDAEGKGPELENFKAEGTKRTQVSFSPDTIVVEYLFSVVRS
jgi:hypothetical protein